MESGLLDMEGEFVKNGALLGCILAMFKVNL
jgi:hypothetical protein